MRYLGSKRLLFKHIAPITLKNRKPGQTWVEPFVGGANMIDKIDGKRIGGDVNKYLIALLKEMQNPLFDPLYIDETLYNDIKNCPFLYPDWVVGFAGFCLSFGAKWFGGWSRDILNSDYGLRAQRSVLAQSKLIKDIEFYNCEYFDLPIPPNSLIYCDPPYEKVTGYKVKFDHPKFWQWCRDKSNEGHDIYISEYQAPEDFICLLEIEQNRGGHGKASVERLFTYL